MYTEKKYYQPETSNPSLENVKEQSIIEIKIMNLKNQQYRAEVILHQLYEAVSNLRYIGCRINSQMHPDNQPISSSESKGENIPTPTRIPEDGLMAELSSLTDKWDSLQDEAEYKILPELYKQIDYIKKHI